MKSAWVAMTLGALLCTASPTQTLREPPSKRASLPVVKVSGNAFWQGDKRFYVRGIDYQPGGASGDIDPIADSKICERDIKEFERMGINALRIYMVDNSKNHKECMGKLADAGIYLMLDLSTPKYSLNRADPHPSYNTDYLQSVFATVDEFAQYDNTLLFFNGNEVINHEANTTKAAPYVKALGRDVKNYMKARGYRGVPIGYSAADVAENRLQTAHYFNCGSDIERSDFFAFNDYSWCNSDIKTSGWDQKVKTFTDYGLPIFLSEYGCIEAGPREFGELKALMSDDMTSVYSGGLMYEYTMEANKYGIVEFKDGKSDGDVVELQPEFDNFAKALKANPAPTGSGGAASTTHSLACPTMDEHWEVDPDVLPAMPTQAQALMKNGAGKGPGFKGAGSQWAVDSGVSATTFKTGESPQGADGDKKNAGVRLGADAKTTALSGAVLVLALFGAVAL